MKVAVLSDIHGNLEALEAVLAELAPTGIERYLLGGDIVGYGANPAECIERALALNPVMVAGNHDWAAVGRLEIESFNEAAAQAVRWTARQLGAAERELLDTLPLAYREEGMVVVHSSPSNPSEWPYLTDVHDVRQALDASDRWLCMVGHSHVPFIYGQSGDQEMFDRRPGRYALRPEWRYLVNVGSVGQPRDGDPRACCAVVDLEGHELDLVRVVYPVSIAQAKIRAESALPDFLAWRLQWGF